MVIQELVDKFKTDGYAVFDLENFNEVIDEINVDIDQLVESGEFRTNSKIYSYNSAPRIVEAWRFSEAVKSLAFNNQVLQLIEALFGEKPKPFSTINFVRSTQQPLHSDYIHFGTVPHLMLVAAWVALEDIDARSGPLQVVPKSQKLPPVCFSDLQLPVARSLGDVKRHYEHYENWVKANVQKIELTAITPTMQKGQVLIWDANLLHGSPECLDNSLSRRSQVTHYHFESTKVFYSPAFSRIHEGQYVKRNVNFIPE
jgi:ectoine hydroxylase-related dioxygenase (phytanoyl-CoA dioxygenase family)